MSEMTWQEQKERVEAHLEAWFRDEPELFRPVEVEHTCSDPTCEHKDVDPSAFVVTGCIMLMQQQNLDGAELTSCYTWPPRLGRVSRLGLIETVRDRMR